MTISDSLKQFRKSKGITQKEMAALLGITFQMYSYYETKGELSATAIKQIAENYQVSTDYLLGLTSEPTPKSSEISCPLQTELNQIKARLDRLEKS